jgi:hypothetical protein
MTNVGLVRTYLEEVDKKLVPVVGNESALMPDSSMRRVEFDTPCP